MSFARITTEKDGRAIAKEMPVPEDIAQTEESKAKALLEEKARGRNMMFQELTPVHDLERPHPRATRETAAAEPADTNKKARG